MTEGSSKSYGGSSASHTENASPQTSSSQARRRLIKAGLIGAPVILTLSSRPAAAQDTPSAIASGMTSEAPPPAPHP